MKKPRTFAQRCADYRKTFPKKVNARRLELIVKQHGPPDPERDHGAFADHPGGEEEGRHRRAANLTDAERAELAECNRILNAWMEKSPEWQDRIAFFAEQEQEIDELKAELQRRQSRSPQEP